MPVTDDIIIATSQLSVTDGAGGSLFADLVPGVGKAYVLGKLGLGTINPQNTLDIDGGAFLGYETSQTDFGATLKSGFYQNAGTKIAGDVPDPAHGWTHVIAARHSNTANNHQLQIAASYAPNDKLYFRKIAGTGTVNPPWNELATRGANSFAGNQGIQGALSVSGNVGIQSALSVTGNVGIGTATPAVRLAVGGPGANVYATDAWIENNLHVQGNEPLQGSASRGRLRVGTAWGYVGMYAEAGSTNAVNDLVLGASSGRVRIGPDGGAQNLLLNGDLEIQSGKSVLGRGRLHIHGEELLYLLNKSGVIVSKAWGGNGNLTVEGDLEVKPDKKLYSAGRMHIHGEEVLYLLNKSGVVIGKEWGGTGDLTVQGNVTVHGQSLTVTGHWLIANGAGGELAYLGGDGSGNDVQVGSFSPSVVSVSFWNGPTGKWMNARANDFLRSSDARLKTNVEPVSGALEKVLKLSAVKFDWANEVHEGKNGKRIGLIAQEVLEIVPEAVSKDNKGMYCISDGPLVSLLIEAVKQQNARIEQLERRNSPGNA